MNKITLKKFLDLLLIQDNKFILLYWSGVEKCECSIVEFLDTFDIFFDLEVSSFDFYDNILEVWCD